MKVNKINTEESVDENCSVPVSKDTVDVLRLTQFSPGAG